MNQKIVIGFIGQTLDNRGKGYKRFERWRPTYSIAQQQSLDIDTFELLHHEKETELAEEIKRDIEALRAKQGKPVRVNLHELSPEDPWNFEEVYSKLQDFCEHYTFYEDIDYFIHITTGTHVMQICLYLLTEANYLQGKLLQTSPDRDTEQPRRNSSGNYQIIDLDLSKYDQIASRFHQQHDTGQSHLKSGIATKNQRFNDMIAEIETVATRSSHPILLSGPTGSGKSQLARRIYELKAQRGQIQGQLIEINCATLRGDNAMSTLFGHKKGAFTGAVNQRGGLLKAADQGVLFLDEIAELGLDEQAMLLRAIEDKIFTPFGADTPVSSEFQLIAGTNKNLYQCVQDSTFREDLLARINLWYYELPGLRDRIEDFAPNVDYELSKYSQQQQHKVSFNNEAKRRYFQFSRSGLALWQANFRDLNASITRMATLSKGGRITEEIVKTEINRLVHDWHDSSTTRESQKTDLTAYPWFDALDLFEQVQIQVVIDCCKNASSMAEAGRLLFAKTRESKKTLNDSHRVKVFLNKYDLDFETAKKL